MSAKACNVHCELHNFSLPILFRHKWMATSTFGNGDCSQPHCQFAWWFWKEYSYGPDV